MTVQAMSRRTMRHVPTTSGNSAQTATPDAACTHMVASSLVWLSGPSVVALSIQLIDSRTSDQAASALSAGGSANQATTALGVLSSAAPSAAPLVIMITDASAIWAISTPS